MSTIQRILEAAKRYKRDDELAITPGELEVITYYVLGDLGIEQLIDANELSLRDATQAVAAGLRNAGQRIEEL